VVERNELVIEMSADEIRKAAFAEAKAQSYETLDRVRDIEVTLRAYHDDDGMLTSWSRNMPPKPKPVPPPTIAEIEALVDGKISAAINQHKEIWRDVLAQALASERQRHRAEVEKLRSEHDLRIAALLQATEKLERGLSGDRSAEVIDLPALPLRVRSG
jgi:hypothetical protein